MSKEKAIATLLAVFLVVLIFLVSFLLRFEASVNTDFMGSLLGIIGILFVLAFIVYLYFLFRINRKMAWKTLALLFAAVGLFVLSVKILALYGGEWKNAFFLVPVGGLFSSFLLFWLFKKQIDNFLSEKQCQEPSKKIKPTGSSAPGEEPLTPGKSAPAAPMHRAPTQPTVKLYSDDKPHSDFPSPEAYCVVCKNTGEDHLAVDRAQRLRQLDDWLKNDLIDKEEYRVLKESFEKNG